MYIAFRILQPDAPRPYRSPVGIAGAALNVVLCTVILVVQSGINKAFQLTVVAYLLKMTISGVYFLFHGRLHLMPTEEAVVHR